MLLTTVKTVLHCVLCIPQSPLFSAAKNDVRSGSVSENKVARRFPLKLKEIVFLSKKSQESIKRRIDLDSHSFMENKKVQLRVSLEETKVHTWRDPI